MIRALMENRTLILIWVMLVALLLVGVVFGAVFSVAAVLLVLLSAWLLPVNRFYVLLFALLPYAKIFKLTPDSTSLFTVAEFVLLALVLLRLKKTNKGFFFAILALLLYMLLFSGEYFDFLIILKVILGIGLFYGFCRVITKQDIVLIGYLLPVSTAIPILLCMSGKYFSYVERYLPDVDYHYDTGAVGGAAKVLRNGGFLGDPNFCALLIICALALLCVLYYYKRVGFEFWAYFAVLGVLGMFTYSKSYILCFAVLCLFLLLFVLYPKNKTLAILFIVLMILFGVAALSGRFGVLNILINRFKEGDLTTNRNNLLVQYWNYIISDTKQLLLGASIAAPKIEGASNEVHNVYVEMLYRLGVIGSLLYVAALSSCLKKQGGLYMTQKRVWANYMPLMFVAVMCFFLPALTDYALPFYIMISYAAFYFHALPDEARG